MADRTCSVESCERAAHARDLCSMHYTRWRKHGDPLKVIIRSPKVVPIDKSGDCWLWGGSVNPGGYGLRGRRLAHRLAWAEVNGPIPPGFYVLHRCDNPPCVNLAHLFLGTHEDNMADMTAKGRSRGQRTTHCVHGHEFTPENTYVAARQRLCKECCRRRYHEKRDRARVLVVRRI